MRKDPVQFSAFIHLPPHLPSPRSNATDVYRVELHQLEENQMLDIYSAHKTLPA